MAVAARPCTEGAVEVVDYYIFHLAILILLTEIKHNPNS